MHNRHFLLTSKFEWTSNHLKTRWHKQLSLDGEITLKLINFNRAYVTLLTFSETAQLQNQTYTPMVFLQITLKGQTCKTVKIVD